jgi:hypothetical protein
MSNAILGYANAIDSAASLTASSYVPSLPVNNVQDPNLKKIWRTNGVTSATFQADFGQAMPVGIVALFGVNLSASATIDIKLSNVALGGNELFELGVSPANVDPNYRQSITLLPSAAAPAPISARYLEIDLADPSPLIGTVSFFTAQGIAPPTPYLDIGRIAALNLFQPQHNFAYGSGFYWIDPSVMQRSKGSTLYVDALPKYRHWEFVLPRVAPSEGATVAQIRQLVGATTDLLFIPDPADMTDAQKQPMWGVVDLTSTQDFFEWDQPVNYNVAFKMDERL